MIGKKDFEKGNTKERILESYWNGLAPHKFKGIHKKHNYKYWTLDWYGFSSQKNKVKN